MGPASDQSPRKPNTSMTRPLSPPHPDTTPSGEAPVLPQVWAIAWPVVVASMLDAMEGLIDISMVGHLGPAAISAVGLSRQILFVTMVMAISVSTGSRTLVAQFYGAGRHGDLSHTAQQAIIMGILLSAVLALVGSLIARPALVLLGAQQDVLAHAVPFLRVYFVGIVFMMPNFIIGGIFGGSGDTRTPLKISCLIICLKIPLTYGLIFGAWGLPQLGVTGAAFGSIVSRAVGCIVGISLLTSGRSRVHMRWNWRLPINRDIIGRMMRIGVPAGIQGFFRNGARVLIYRVVGWTSRPTAATAALTIGLQMRMIGIMPALAFSVSATALVGQRLGAGQIREAERFAANTIRLGMTFITVSAIVICVFAREIVDLFTDSAAVIEMGYIVLLYFTVAQVFSALSIVAGGVLAGGGETRPLLYYTIVAQWLLMLPLSYVLAFLLDMDVMGIWIAWFIGGVAQGILAWARYRKGAWKQTLI